MHNPMPIDCINMGAVGHQKFFVNKTIVSPVAPKTEYKPKAVSAFIIFSLIYILHMYMFFAETQSS